MRKLRPSLRLLLLPLALVIPAFLVHAAGTVPTDIQLPGTQPGEAGAFTSPDNCDNCHGGTANPAYEPAFGWRGGMMANATRDGLFWATLAIAEQDFLPGTDPATRGGAGDLCIRCHSVNGWISGRSTPTDGSGLAAGDVNGVECEFCHLLVDPDPPVSIAGTTEAEYPPFTAYDSSHTYRGSAEWVVNSNGTRLGPFADPNAKHAWLQSPFHRSANLCATCHDVSNSAVGDLAPNNGAQQPLDPGTYSGTVGTPVEQKAAFNNQPHQFGIVERTFSEWTASAFSTLLVDDEPTLPADLRTSGGSIDVAYHRAHDARSEANYEDGTLRTYTCQTCHMAAATGVGCNKPGTPTRTDLPRHDQTGGGYWMPSVVQWQDARGTLRMGGGLTQLQKDALDAGASRAEAHLSSAASLSASQVGPDLVVRVTNLTGHKLLSGYPEGRRMWLNVRWYDAGNQLVAEDGAYGPIGRTAPDKDGVQMPVSSLIDPASTVVYEVEMGLDQAWAAKLLSLGYPGTTVLSWDRMTDTPSYTLADLAAEPAGTAHHSFHFVLNNSVVADDRIPPYGFAYDVAKARNCLPVPATQFGDPGAGGTYQYWDERSFPVPDGATSAQIRLYYQQTSWEYVQFLWRQNDGLSPFLGAEGANMLDAWLHTGMSSPHQMALTGITGLTPPTASPPGEPSHQDVKAEAMKVSWNPSTSEVSILYTPACSATGHTIYLGPIASVASYGWSEAVCSTDTSGSLAFTSAEPSFFFVVVGENGSQEGTYGVDSALVERPEATGLGACDYPQSLAATCD